MQLDLSKRSQLHWPLLALGGLLVWKSAKTAARYVPRWWVELLPYASTDWRKKTPSWGVPLVLEASRVTGVPPVLLVALIRTESAWQPKVVSKAGAIGLTQLMPATARGLGVDPWDPAQNVMGGARYLREQLDRFQSVKLALAAYNAGPHRVVQYGGVPPFRETQAYVSRVFSRLWPKDLHSSVAKRGGHSALARSRCPAPE